MKDYLEELERFKDIKEIADLCDDIKKLHEYYYSGQYDKMQQHIRSLMAKYFFETVAWNTTHQTVPMTIQQSYNNAEAFLRLKGLAVLLQKGIETQGQLSADEIGFIESIIKPKGVVQ